MDEQSNFADKDRDRKNDWNAEQKVEEKRASKSERVLIFLSRNCNEYLRYALN